MANYKPVQNMSNLYEKFRAMLGPSYTPQSASTLKDTISRAVRGGYDKQIRARQDATRSNTGEIVASSAGSGMGTSTTMQNRLLSARDAEAKDIANIESDYQANVYNMLLNRLNAQDEIALSAENNLRNSALDLAQRNYGKVFGNHGSGGGRGYYSTSGDNGLTDEEKAALLAKFGRDQTLANMEGGHLAERAAIERRNQGFSTPYKKKTTLPGAGKPRVNAVK